MGIDRSQVYQGTCPCGAGEVNIEFCTPDHPWPTKSTWFVPTITCAKCAETYVFEEQDQYYGLIDKKEIIKSKQWYEAYNAAQDSLMVSPRAKEIISRFTELLDSQKSMAACHRLLSAYRLVNQSYGAFTKQWKGASSWVKSNIRADDLEQMLAAVGAQDEYISKAVLELKKLWAEYRRPLPFHGEPLFGSPGE